MARKRKTPDAEDGVTNDLSAVDAAVGEVVAVVRQELEAVAERHPEAAAVVPSMVWAVIERRTERTLALFASEEAAWAYVAAQAGSDGRTISGYAVSAAPVRGEREEP